jgi:hypothetical protein
MRDEAAAKQMHRMRGRTRNFSLENPMHTSLAKYARFVMAGKTKALPRKEIRPLVIARAKTGKCLIGAIIPSDAVPVCDCKSKTRGNCETHYQAFARALSAIAATDPVAADEFEDESIRDGKILPNQWIRIVHGTNPYSKAAS